LDSGVFKQHNLGGIKTLKCKNLNNRKSIDLLHPSFESSNHF